MDIVALLALVGNVGASAGPPPRPLLPFRAPPWGLDHPQFLFEDSRLPPDHVARQIDRLVDCLDLAALELSFRGVGTPPFPPRLLLKLVLYEAHRKHHQPSLWAEHARDSGPLRWLLRGALPSRSSLYRFRCRLHDWLLPLNRDVIQAAVNHRLTPAAAGALDGTLFNAHASRHTLLNEDALNRRLANLVQVVAQDRAPRPAPPSSVQAEPPAQLAPAQAEPPQPLASAQAEALANSAPCPTPAPAPAPVQAQRRLWPLPVLDSLPVDEAGVAPVPATSAAAPLQTQPAGGPGLANTSAAQPQPHWMAETASGRQEQLKRLRLAEQRLQERLRENERRCKEDRLPRERVVISPSDPQAALGRDKLKVFGPIYNAQIMTDLETRLILSYGVFSQSADAGTFKPMLERTGYLVGRQVPVQLADSAYATGPNLADATQAGVTLYAPWQANDLTKDGGKAKQIPKEQFRWDQAEQTYYCPEGHRLEKLRDRVFKRNGTQTPLVEYRCPPKHCQGCPRAAQCARNPKSGRTISRNLHEDKIAELRQRMASPEGKQLYKKRKSTVELSLADAKEHRGFRRLSAKGLRGAQTQVGILVLVHNLLTVYKLLGARQAAPDDATTCCNST
jgi:transposase